MIWEEASAMKADTEQTCKGIVGDAKPKYEAPVLTPLGALARGAGGPTCFLGTSASDDCIEGAGASQYCQNGGSATWACSDGSGVS